MVGQTVSNYKILEKLGQGGMGSVYKAQDVRLDRFAVLKFLLPHISQDEGAKERFVQEAKAASADKDRGAMLDRARHEADEIVAKAKADAEALVERRTRMAESKIAAEERAAIEQLRTAAADAATKAAAKLIAERNDAKTDGQLIDRAIKEIASR